MSIQLRWMKKEDGIKVLQYREAESTHEWSDCWHDVPEEPETEYDWKSK